LTSTVFDHFPAAGSDPSEPLRAPSPGAARRIGALIPWQSAGRFWMRARGPRKPVVEGYVVEAFIAEGGLGRVWRARRSETDKLVALKIPHRADPELGARLVAEAEVLRAFHHPNIVGFQEITETDDEVPALVMDLVDGSPLAAPAQMPGGRWRLEPVFIVQAQRPDFATQELPGPLHFTFDLAHVDGRWRIVGYWSHGVKKVPAGG